MLKRALGGRFCAVHGGRKETFVLHVSRAVHKERIPRVGYSYRGLRDRAKRTHGASTVPEVWHCSKLGCVLHVRHYD